MKRERASSRIRHPEDVACGGGGARKKRSLHRDALACSGALLLFVVGACSRDWDAYDPRGGGVGPTGTGGAGAGGAGGMGVASSTGGPVMCAPGATIACYSAAEETANIGPCKKGTAVCAPSGTS